MLICLQPPLLLGLKTLLSLRTELDRSRFIRQGEKGQACPSPAGSSRDRQRPRCRSRSLAVGKISMARLAVRAMRSAELKTSAHRDSCPCSSRAFAFSKRVSRSSDKSSKKQSGAILPRGGHQATGSRQIIKLRQMLLRLAHALGRVTDSSHRENQLRVTWVGFELAA